VPTLRTLVFAATAAGAALALTLAGPARAGDVPALLVPAALARPDRAFVAGRLLEERQGEHGPAALRTARALANENLSGVEVEVELLGRTARGTSGHDGEFAIEVPAAPGAPFPPGAHRVRVRAGEARAEAVVHVVDPAAPFLLVSDLDDTLAVTNVTDPAGVARAVFLEDAETQPAVQGMAAFLRCVAAPRGPGEPRATLAIVSGSPVQLAPRVARFLEKNGYPPAALFLRNLGPGTLSGYKEPVLRTLLARFPQPVVLVGDSGERDPEIYAALGREHPGRVLRAYVRRAVTGRAPGPEDPRARWFEDPAEAARDAAARGLADPRCVKEAFPPAR
jgi:phosphatidate phosphatase APP1